MCAFEFNFVKWFSLLKRNIINERAGWELFTHWGELESSSSSRCFFFVYQRKIIRISQHTSGLMTLWMSRSDFKTLPESESSSQQRKRLRTKRHACMHSWWDMLAVWKLTFGKRDSLKSYLKCVLKIETVIIGQKRASLPPPTTRTQPDQLIHSRSRPSSSSSSLEAVCRSRQAKKSHKQAKKRIFSHSSFCRHLHSWQLLNKAVRYSHAINAKKLLLHFISPQLSLLCADSQR